MRLSFSQGTRFLRVFPVLTWFIALTLVVLVAAVTWRAESRNKAGQSLYEGFSP